MIGVPRPRRRDREPLAQARRDRQVRLDLQPGDRPGVPASPRVPRRPRAGVDRRRLPALLRHAAGRRNTRRRAHPRPPDRGADDRQSAPGGAAAVRGQRPRAARLRLRARGAGAARSGRRPALGLGRRVQLGRGRQHLLLDRSGRGGRSPSSWRRSGRPDISAWPRSSASSPTRHWPRRRQLDGRSRRRLCRAPRSICPWRNSGCVRAAIHPGWLRYSSLTYRPARCQPGASPPPVRAAPRTRAAQAAGAHSMARISPNSCSSLSQPSPPSVERNTWPLTL